MAKSLADRIKERQANANSSNTAEVKVTKTTSLKNDSDSGS